MALHQDDRHRHNQRIYDGQQIVPIAEKGVWNIAVIKADPQKVKRAGQDYDIEQHHNGTDRLFKLKSHIVLTTTHILAVILDGGPSRSNVPFCRG